MDGTPAAMASKKMKPPEQSNAAGLKSLADFIAENFKGNQSAFARANGVQRAQVTQWIKAGYIVAGNKLCAVRRVINDS